MANAEARRLLELQNELQRTMRQSMAGEIGAALSHELNQPLAAIVNYLQAGRRMLESGRPVDPERLAALMEKTAEQAGRAGDIVRRLRQLAGREDGARRRADLGDLVAEALALTAVGPAAAGVAVRTVPAAGGLPVDGDRLQLLLVLGALLRNALDALAGVAAPELVVELGRAGGMATVTVRDNGPGVDPAVRERLFRPFATGKARGLGLDLSICRTVLAAHGGRLVAEDAPAGGAAFRIELPLASEASDDR